MRFLSSEANPILGEMVETSGHGGKFPSGINVGKVIWTKRVMYRGFNVQDSQVFIARGHFHFYPVSTIMEIKIFKENYSIEYVEFKLKKDS